MTSYSDQPGSTPPSNRSPDKADIVDAIAGATALQVIRDQLRQRINTYTHPSRLINEICLADLRCSESAQALTRLIGRSPKVLRVIRAELYKTFQIDPDSVLFTETWVGMPAKVDSLTERALLLLVKPAVPINANLFTTLSVKGDPHRRLPYTPLQVQQRVIALNLSERLSCAATDYWDSLARGTWLTRRERWVELNSELFADRAFMARQLDELSKTGMSMVQAVIDAPTAEARQRAGGDWASVRVGQLMWPGTPAVAIPGALHIFREGDRSDVPHVLYLPGVVRNFYEYPSFVALQCGVLELHRSLFHDLWQCLPLSRRNQLCRPADLSPASSVLHGLEVTDDALAMGAKSLLSEQWSNEVACAKMVYHAHVFSTQRPQPQPLNVALFLAQVEGTRRQLVGGARLGVVRDELLTWDQQRRSAEITFASTAPGLPLRTVEQRVKSYEKGLLALLNADDPNAKTPALEAFELLMRQLEVHAKTLTTLTKGAQRRLGDEAFWAERPGGVETPRRGTLFMNAQTEALRCEVELQHRLRLLSKADRDLMIEVVEQPSPEKRPGSQTRVLSIAVGCEPDAFYSLLNLWLVTTAAAVRVPARQLPVVLYVFGVNGGVMAFSGLDALTRSVKASLSSPDDSVLWGCVERDKRNDLRAHAMRDALAVRYVPIDRKPALASIEKLLGTFGRLLNSTEDITRIFSEVKDPEFSRALLTVELEEQLEVPVNSALNQALANIELLRKAAAATKSFPAWQTQATRAQHTHFKRLLRLYLSGTFAFKTRLEHYLPDLVTFAHRALTARLREDGIPLQFDIDKDFIDMPDDVQSHYCGNSSACSVGDRSIIKTPSVKRTTFSLLQLVLHNLDPLAPWTQWRFDYARFLQPDWKQQLNASYLIRMVSSLDIGGQYETLINTVFYPPARTDRTLSEGRIPELLNRTLQAGFALHLFAATQRGLSATAQSVFSTAMAARAPQDLLKNQHELQLYVVHLVGHTMQHDRYIAGTVVVHDKRSGLCIVYWPTAGHAQVLTEYASLKQACVELNRIGALPDNVKRLARQVAPGWAFEAINHDPTNADDHYLVNWRSVAPGAWLIDGIWQVAEFIRSFRITHLEPTPLLDEIETVIREQIKSDSQGWLAVVATSHSNAQALLYRASVLELQCRTQAASHSGKALQEYRVQRLDGQTGPIPRRLIAFFSPIVGRFNDIYELLLVARQYHRFGDSRDLVDVIFLSGLLALDILLDLIPGPKKVASGAARFFRPSLKAALGRIHRLRMTTRQIPRLAPSPVTRLKALERFKLNGRPEGAVALKGPGEQGIQVKNGEPFVADDTHYYPLYRRGNESSFRLKNKQGPGQDELILDTRRTRELLLGADAPQPVAGSSSAALQPWPAAVPDWRPSTARSVTENAILQSSAMGDRWFSWRISPELDADFVSAAPGVFYIGGDARMGSHYVLRVAPAYTHIRDPSNVYYRLLPQGDQAPLTGIVFITRRAPVSAARVDIGLWTTTEFGEQPLPASYNTLTNQWQFHAPLFDRPLEQSIGTAFPTMTASSQRFTAQRLIELSDSAREATATHLLNARSTLDTWLTSSEGRIGQTDDLLRMLRPTEKPYSRIHIGYEGEAPGFTRVDFQVSGLDPSLLFGGQSVAVERSTAQRAAIKSVLEQQGFNVREVTVRHGRPINDLIATHPNSNQLYYVSPSWAEEGSIQLNTRLSDLWFNDALSKKANALPLEGVKRALDEGRLVRIVAGIQWPTKRTLSPTVYFVKVNRLPR